MVTYVKKIAVLFLITAFVLNSFALTSWAATPQVKAKSAILIDGITGEVLWAKNPYDKLPIASTTKIMTAVVVIERANLNGKITVSKAIEKVGQSEIGLIRKEKVDVEELLQALLVHSANDAAYALAEYTSGSVKNFVKFMNKKAKQLGANDTHFSNPDGLSSKNHYSTAYDLAVIGHYAMQKPLFKKIVAMKKTVVNGKKKRTLETRNKLLLRYEPAIGIKTGYTKEAGFCLVSAANKEGKHLIGVTLGSPTQSVSFVNSESLLENGYDNFAYIQIALGKKFFKLTSVPYYDEKLPLSAKQSVGYFKTKNSKITWQMRLSSRWYFPIKKDSVQGWLVIKRSGKVVSKTPLLAGREFEAPTFWQKVTYVVSHWMRGIKSFFSRLAFE